MIPRLSDPDIADLIRPLERCSCGVRASNTRVSVQYACERPIRSFVISLTQQEQILNRSLPLTLVRFGVRSEVFVELARDQGDLENYLDRISSFGMIRVPKI